MTKIFVKKLIALSLAVSSILSLAVNTVSYAEDAPIENWTVRYISGAAGSVEIDHENFYSGNGSMKIVSTTPNASGVYIEISQALSLTAGRKYEFKAVAKGKDVSTFVARFDREAAYSLMPFGKNFVWTQYSGEFIPQQTKSYSFWIWVQGTCKGAWLDDIELIDTVTGQNVIKNGNFDTEETTVSDVKEQAEVDKYNEQMQSGRVNLKDLFYGMAATDTLAVYKTGNRKIVVDGDDSEWEDVAPIHLPFLPKQKVIAVKDTALDNEADVKFLCDDRLLYVQANVTDTFHNPVMGASAWAGDAIQMMLGVKGGDYGVEFTFAFTEDGQVTANYGTMNPAYEDEIQIAGKRNGDVSTYEFAVPWTAVFGGAPEPGQACINILINESDGKRRNWIEWDVDGISKGKSSVNSPALEIIDDSEDIYGWIQTINDLETNTDYKFPFYICNTGNGKTLEITCEQTGYKEKVSIGKGEVLVRTLDTKFEELVTDYPIEVKIAYEGKETVLKQKITTRTKFDKDSVQNLANTYRVWADELLNLMQRCNEKGIQTDYEQTAVGLLKRFAEYFEADLEYDNFKNKDYQHSALSDIYEKAKSDLQSYLDGTKEAKPVTKYVTSKLRFDGRTAYAMTDTNGVFEERPIFLNGFGHFNDAANDYELFNYLGLNANQYSALPSASQIQGWRVRQFGTPAYSVTKDTEVFAEGKASMKIDYKDAWNANNYVLASQEFGVKPNTKYIFKAKVKSENSNALGIRLNNGPAGRGLGFPGGTYDWTEIEDSIVTGPDQRVFNMEMMINSKMTYWVDDLSFCEAGSNHNLMMDPGCETVGEETFAFDEDTYDVKAVREYLASAEENNIAVDVLISPHTIPSSYMTQLYIVPDFAVGGLFDDEKLLERWEINLKGWAELFNEYESVHSICINNEPVFYAYDYAKGEAYADEWRLFLKKRYEDSISALNEVWKTEFNSFDEVPLLDYNAALYQNTWQRVDYGTFNSEMAAGFYRFTAETLKKYTDIPLTVKILGYLWPSSREVQVMRGNDMSDFHKFLDVMGCDTMHEIDSTWGDYPHEFWYDYISTFDNSTIVNTEDHNVRDKDPMTKRIAEYVGAHQWMGALHGASFVTHWIWESSPDPANSKATTMGRRPDVIAAVANTTKDLNRLGWEVSSILKEEREVAILYSTPSAYLYGDMMSWTMGRAWEAAIFNGQQVKIVNDNDIHLLEGSKVLIIPAAAYVREDTLSAIKTYIDNGGKTIIMSRDALRYNEKGEPSKAELVNYIFEHSALIEPVSKGGVGGSIDNIANIEPTDFVEMFKAEFKNAGIQYVNVIDNITGKPVVNVEYNLGVHDGKVLVNLIYQKEDEANDNKINVSVYLGNKRVTGGTDLIENEPIGENIELETWKPILLEISDVNTFFDTYGHWAEADIANLASKGIIKGISESRYAPQNSITRAEFLALLVRASGINESVYTGNVSDVTSDKWYANTVETGMISGIIDISNTFRPEENITREEMCEMLIRCYEIKANADSRTLNFNDNALIDKKEYVGKAVGLGFVIGREDGNFGPKDSATRAEAAAVISRYIK